MDNCFVDWTYASTGRPATETICVRQTGFGAFHLTISFLAFMNRTLRHETTYLS